MPRVSVIMPVFGANGMNRAVASLRAQTVADWELVVVDDGSPDPVEVAGARVVRHPENRGLGAALNTGLDHARGELVAYLPVDDVWHPGHLAALLGGARPAAPGDRLVAVAHPHTDARWPERDVVETDDLVAEAGKGDGLPCLRASPGTCAGEPGARTRALRPSLDGGPATFRRRYGVRGPLRIVAEGQELVDERRRYARFADAPPPEPGGLRVLLAGELAYNPERILALEARGVTLSGLWIDDPLGFMTVGPLPFGHVTDVEPGTWKEARPDVVYALLNWRCVPLAHRLLGQGVPLVFHYKEAPQRSIARGEWDLLAEVVTRADAVILSSREERDWFAARLDLDPERLHVIDGDLPKRDWLDAEPSQAHDPMRTVVLGRRYGFDDELVEGLRDRGIEVDFRTDVEPADWVTELSRYGAGWLHPVRASEWDDLNLPARIPSLVAAGLPLIIPKPPPGAVHAAARLATELGCGVLYEDLDDLAAQLRDTGAQRAAAWAARETLTFDHHADRLVAILRRASASCR